MSLAENTKNQSLLSNSTELNSALSLTIHTVNDDSAALKKEADLSSAFIKVPYTQGAQVRITQCYLQITPYLPLSRKHSPDGASQTEVADI